jgi:hypothetical protein
LRNTLNQLWMLNNLQEKWTEYTSMNELFQNFNQNSANQYLSKFKEVFRLNKQSNKVLISFRKYWIVKDKKMCAEEYLLNKEDTNKQKNK